MFQQVAAHLKNLQDFKKLGIDHLCVFRLVDRDLIFQGFKTLVEKVEGDYGLYAYSFWKKEDKSDLFSFNFLYFDRQAALYVRRTLVIYKEKFEGK